MWKIYHKSPNDVGIQFMMPSRLGNTVKVPSHFHREIAPSTTTPLQSLVHGYGTSFQVTYTL